MKREFSIFTKNIYHNVVINKHNVCKNKISYETDCFICY